MLIGVEGSVQSGVEICCVDWSGGECAEWSGGMLVRVEWNVLIAEWLVDWSGGECWSGVEMYSLEWGGVECAEWSKGMLMEWRGVC